MKLLLVIVSNEDVQKVSSALLKAKFFVTKMASTGGLLAGGSTTLLVGTSPEKVDEAIDVISRFSKSRKKAISGDNIDDFNIFSSYPVEVNVSGATIFVIDIEKTVKL